MRRALPSLLSLLCALGAAATTAACGSGGPDRTAYVKANEATFGQLPIFPGAKLRKESSDADRSEEDGPVVGYTTVYDFDLPEGTEAPEVTSFYRHRLERTWHLIERLDGPVLNFSNGRAALSINLEGWRAHQLEIAVDHNGGH